MDYFTLTPEEKMAMMELIEECKTIIEDNFRPDGYNIGIISAMQPARLSCTATAILSPGTRGIPIIPEVESAALLPGNTTRIPCEPSVRERPLIRKIQHLWEQITDNCHIIVHDKIKYKNCARLILLGCRWVDVVKLSFYKGQKIMYESESFIE
jgi:hypothetical protein